VLLGQRDDELFRGSPDFGRLFGAVFAVDIAASVSIGSAVIAGLVALVGVMGYQNRRARLLSARRSMT
jgi:hypothetical protein